MDSKLKELETKFNKEVRKYFKTMNHQVMAVEIDALYNVLVLKKESEYDLTRRHENNVKRILNIKP